MVWVCKHFRDKKLSLKLKQSIAEDFRSRALSRASVKCPYGAFNTGSAQGSGLSSENSELSLSRAWAEPSVWTRFSSDFQCRLGISDLSYRMFTLTARLRLGSESEPSPEPSQCEIPQYASTTKGKKAHLLSSAWIDVCRWPICIFCNVVCMYNTQSSHVVQGNSI